MANNDTRVDRRTALLAGAGLVGTVAELASGRRLAEAAGMSRPYGALPTQSMDSAIHGKGQMLKGGVYSYSFGREDLHPVLGGIHIHPDFALAADIFFLPMGGMAMVMAEIPMRESEVNPTISRALNEGFMMSALHNHRILMSPHVMWAHFMAQGDPTTLAGAVNSIFPSGARFDRSGSQPKHSPLPATALGSTLGGDVTLGSGGTAQVSVERNNQMRMNGMAVPPSFGVESEIYFQHIGKGRAAVSGELALIANEVPAVTRTLRQHGIDISALHNHHLHDQPHLFFMHTWAVGNPLALARIHRMALDQTNSKRA